MIIPLALEYIASTDHPAATFHGLNKWVIKAHDVLSEQVRYFTLADISQWCDVDPLGIQQLVERMMND